MVAIRTRGIFFPSRNGWLGWLQWLLALIIVAAALGLTRGSEQEDILMGWKGETHHVNSARSLATASPSVASLAAKSTATLLRPAAHVIQLSWKPRAFLYKGFLSHEECDHIIKLAAPSLERSTVVDEEKSGSAVHNIRTSYGMFLDLRQDSIIAAIEDRVAAWTFLPVENQENIQVLRYNFGQKYESHYDYYDTKDAQPGGHRYATVLMYLTDVEAGGETVFPNSEPDKVNGEKGETWSDCGKRGVAVKPRKGDALLFFNMKPEGNPDPTALHAGCPVISGQKWSATKWIHENAFHIPPRDTSICVDENDGCIDWAAAGECANNRDYMVGTRDQPGFCRHSCSACNLTRR